MSKTTPKYVTVKSQADPLLIPLNRQMVDGDTVDVGSVPYGKYDVNIEGDGYGSQGLAIDVQKDTNMTIRINPKTYTLTVNVTDGQIGLGNYTLKVNDKIRNLTYTLTNDKGTAKTINNLPYSDYHVDVESNTYHTLSSADFTLNGAKSLTLSR